MLDLWDWAVADPLLVGFAPWHYSDEPSYGTVMGLGMRQLPETLSVYTELGMRMRRHLGPQLKSDDGMTSQVILPPAPAVSNEGGSSPLLVLVAGCFLALGSGLGLVGTASSRR